MNKIIFAAALSIIVTGCSKEPAAKDVKTEAPTPVPTAAEGTKAVETTTAATPSGSLGVAECDALYANVAACIKAKIPADKQQAMIEAFNASKADLLRMVDKSDQAQSCIAKAEEMRPQYTAMGCKM